VLDRIPIRLRLTLFFTLGTAAVLLAVAAFVYQRASDDMLKAIDSGLLSRAELIESALAQKDVGVVNDGARLIDSDEAFAQILDSNGSILESSSAVSEEPLVPPSQLGRMTSYTLLTRPVADIDFPARLLVDPRTVGGQQYYVIVGTKLADRQDALDSLRDSLVLGGLVALTAMAFGGWLLAGAALRPVERMRKDAAAISVLEAGRKLRVPPANDELARLAQTLNDMLGRLSDKIARERTFIDEASHELRTPLSILKAELDLAISRPRLKSELQATIKRAQSETDRLVRLARDLLVLARTEDGRVAIAREPVSLAELLEDCRLAWVARAAEAGVSLRVAAADGNVFVDRDRLRQALDNLIDNAVRHADVGGEVVVQADVNEERVKLTVENSGAAFPSRLLASAFEPFVMGGDDEATGAGLGLAIVREVAIAHGGSAWAENRQGNGARVILEIPAQSGYAGGQRSSRAR
jgi:two-component system, OmpR family, sensor kinase